MAKKLRKLKKAILKIKKKHFTIKIIPNIDP